MSDPLPPPADLVRAALAVAASRPEQPGGPQPLLLALPLTPEDLAGWQTQHLLDTLVLVDRARAVLGVECHRRATTTAAEDATTTAAEAKPEPPREVSVLDLRMALKAWAVEQVGGDMGKAVALSRETISKRYGAGALTDLTAEQRLDLMRRIEGDEVPF